MADHSKIEWCDSTFNPWEGCTKVGPGCDHCYAEARNNRFQGGNWGPGAPRRRTSEANWRKPVKWNKEAGLGMFVQCYVCGNRREFRKWDNTLPPGGLACCSNPDCISLPESDSFSVRPRVFCASLADWLDNEVPIEWLVDLLDLIRLTPNLDWLLLTKRIGNWEKRLDESNAHAYDETSDRHADLFEWIDGWLNGMAPANVWLGATIVDQNEADRDTPKLLKTPASVRFLSMEPLLRPVNLGRIALPPGSGRFFIDSLHTWYPTPSMPTKIDWVIAGGESGTHARPSHPDWFRSLRDQCQAADVPFLFKQWGEWAPGITTPPRGYGAYEPFDFDSGKTDFLGGPNTVWKCGKRNAGRVLDGRTWDQFPG